MHPIDGIIISSASQYFESQLNNLRKTIIKAAAFDAGDHSMEELRKIVSGVEAGGDKAVAELTEKFDAVKLAPEEFLVTPEELQKAHEQIDPDLLASLRQAIANVKKYQAEIFFADKVNHPGLKLLPLKRVGICVPGASAPLPSTVIMTAVPAQVAGVKEIAVVSPPRYQGSIHPVILAVCFELGITEVYRLGGAQAVAALAYGTETIAKVDKIVGPGNKWVQLAKKEVFGQVDIDSIAGPSEVLIIADDNANPAWVAADMLSQAEHAPGSAIVFTNSEILAQNVLGQLKEQLSGLDREKETTDCLVKFGAIAVFSDLDEAIREANDFATEHLEIQCGPDSRKVAEKIQNAGAIFIGDYTPVAVGDYWAGPSHTLPTGTTAKFFSPLSSNDFVKSTSVIEYNREKLAESADHIVRLAQTEGLDAHAKSIKIRQPD